MVLTLENIIKNNYLLSAFGFTNPSISNKINVLKFKYPNLMDSLQYKDGYAFDSNIIFVKKQDNLIPLIQINNVNETEFHLDYRNQNVFVPKKLLQEKNKYSLTDLSVLVSLTGGADKKKKISSFFDGSYEAMLNQRVCSYTLKEGVNIDLLYYFYAMTLSDIFKEQWIGNGGVQKNTNKKEKDNLYIPHVDTQVITYISVLAQCIINKSREISRKYELILDQIQSELEKNQKNNKFQYNLPNISEIMKLDRIDSSLYSKDFRKKEFLITNYKYGVSSVKELGFQISRGQNLQVSNIGKSIHTDVYKENYYTLILPKFLSKYGTICKKEYLGNPNVLKTLKKGDIVFGAEGNEKGRSLVIIEEQSNAITNIHGITLNQKKHSLTKGIFIKLFLDYYRENGMIDSYAVGGNGGSLAIKYWDCLKFPNFPIEKENQIVKLYHNSISSYQTSNLKLDDFLDYDTKFNQEAGIYELDKSMKYLQEKLNDAINAIVDDVKVKIEF